MPIDPKPGGTDIIDLSGNGKGADINSDPPMAEFNATGLDIPAGYNLQIGSQQVVGARQAAISNALTDSQKIAAILNAIRAHGLIDP